MTIGGIARVYEDLTEILERHNRDKNEHEDDIETQIDEQEVHTNDVTSSYHSDSSSSSSSSNTDDDDDDDVSCTIVQDEPSPSVTVHTIDIPHNNTDIQTSQEEARESNQINITTIPTTPILPKAPPRPPIIERVRVIENDSIESQVKSSELLRHIRFNSINEEEISMVNFCNKQKAFLADKTSKIMLTAATNANKARVEIEKIKNGRDAMIRRINDEAAKSITAITNEYQAKKNETDSAMESCQKLEAHCLAQLEDVRKRKRELEEQQSKEEDIERHFKRLEKY